MIELKNDFEGNVKRGDIFWYSFNGNILPAIVIQNDRGNEHSTFTIIVKMGASKKLNEKFEKIPTIVWIKKEEIVCTESKARTLKENGYALTSEIYTVKKELLKHYIGKLHPNCFWKVEKGLMISLGIPYVLKKPDIEQTTLDKLPKSL